MKISGRVVSRKAISLSRASKLISRFAAVENGSSPAVSIYLHRTSDAFNHLVQFHSKTKNFLSRLPSARRVRHRLLPPAAVCCAAHQSRVRHRLLPPAARRLLRRPPESRTPPPAATCCAPPLTRTRAPSSRPRILCRPLIDRSICFYVFVGYGCFWQREKERERGGQHSNYPCKVAEISPPFKSLGIHCFPLTLQYGESVTIEEQIIKQLLGKKLLGEIKKKKAEERLQAALQDFKAVKSSEAMALENLKFLIEKTVRNRASPSRPSTITNISKFEYEYLKGNVAEAKEIADKTPAVNGVASNTTSAASISTYGVNKAILLCKEKR